MSENLTVQAYERKVTAAERFFAHSPFAIVTMVLRIKGYVSEEMLRRAVIRVQQRHALLRVRIQTDADHTSWFTSESVREIPIGIVPRESEDDWIEIHAQVSGMPFEFETHPAIRFVLVQSPELSELIIVSHHIICDGMSLAYLAPDLMVHLGEPGREVEVLPAPRPIDLDNLPSGVSQPGLVKFLIGRMNRKWAKEAVFFDQEGYRVLTEAYWHHYHHELFSTELPEAETSALVARCREEKVTVNSALTAAFTGSLELDRLIMQPGGGIPLANANLVLGAVTCSGKLSLVVEYVEEAVEAATMEKIKDQAMEYLFET